MDILLFHSDPKHYIKPYLSKDELEDKKNKMKGALDMLQNPEPTENKSEE